MRGCGFAWALVGATVALPADPFDPLAAEYVQLVLAIGQHSADYVDAYYGPPEWREAANQAGRRPLAELAQTAERLRSAVLAVPVEAGDRRRELRRDFLDGQLASARAYVELLQGHTLPFDDEAEALYGIRPPREDLDRFEALLPRLETLIPGDGPIATRYQAWRARFTVPAERVAEAMHTTIDEARRRTRARVALPEHERFVLSLVHDKPWAAYNWYRGDAQSLIEVNVSLPLYASQIIQYAAHEGYPGHHVYNVLQESRLVQQQGRVEHTILPLFSPVAVIAEGSAEAAMDVVFPAAERTEYERAVLFPLAGLPVAEVERYAEVRELTKALGGARVQLAREYLEGRWSAQAVEEWLVTYGLVTPAEAQRSIRFFDTYRSYIVNYSVGERLVLAWLEAQAGHDADARWTALIDLLESPRLPAALLAESKR